MKSQIRTPRMLDDERVQLCSLLIKAGYTVRITTVKSPNKNTKEKVIEFWEEGEMK